MQQCREREKNTSFDWTVIEDQEHVPLVSGDQILYPGPPSLSSVAIRKLVT